MSTTVEEGNSLNLYVLLLESLSDAVANYKLAAKQVTNYEQEMVHYKAGFDISIASYFEKAAWLGRQECSQLKQKINWLAKTAISGQLEPNKFLEELRSVDNLLIQSRYDQYLCIRNIKTQLELQQMKISFEKLLSEEESL